MNKFEKFGRQRHSELITKEKISLKPKEEIKTSEDDKLKELISSYIKKPESKEKSESRPFDDVLEIVSNKPKMSRSSDEGLLLLLSNQIEKTPTKPFLETARKLADNIRQEMINNVLESDDNDDEQKKTKRKLKVLIRALEICKNPSDNSIVNQEDVRELENKIWDITKTFEENDISVSKDETVVKNKLPKIPVPENSLPKVGGMPPKVKSKQEKIAKGRDEEAEIMSNADIFKNTLSNLSKQAGIDLLTSSMDEIEKFAKKDDTGLMDGMMGMIKDHRKKLGIDD